MTKRPIGKLEREIMRHVEPIVAAAGGRCWTELGGRHGHAKLYIEVGNIVRHTPMAGTPRQADNAVLMKVADVKRILREIDSVSS